MKLRRLLAGALCIMGITAKAETIVVGDSFALGWPRFTNIPQHSRMGVGGSTAAQWARDQDGWLSRALKTDADTAVVSLMANDALLALQGDSVVSADEAMIAGQSLRKVVRALQHSGKTVYIILYPVPMDSLWRYPRWLPHYVNRQIENATGDLDVQYIDLTGILIDESHFVSRTDFHPSHRGYRLIAEHVEEILR